MGVVPRRIWLTVWILLTQEEQEDFSKIIQLWKGELLDWILPQLHPPWHYCGQDFFMRTLNFSSIDPVDTVKADKSHLRTNVFLPFLHRGHPYIFSMFKDSSYPQILVRKALSQHWSQQRAAQTQVPLTQRPSEGGPQSVPAVQWWPAATLQTHCCARHRKNADENKHLIFKLLLDTC